MATTSKPKAYELVLWVDPASEFDGWQRIDKMVATASVEVYSIGWPVREDETTLYLAMDFHDDEANTIGKIPLNAIKARKRVNLRGFPPKEKKSVIAPGVPVSVDNAKSDNPVDATFITNLHKSDAPPGTGSEVLK